jgi:hypothetical protein
MKASAGTSTLVLLRWMIPARRPYASSRELIRALIAPAVRSSGWLSSPDTTHHISEQGGEAWLTVITPVDDATEVQDDLADLLRSPPTLEVASHALLAPDSTWYCEALQTVTHIGLEVSDAAGAIPLSEYEAFESPSDTAFRLMSFLNEVSETHRRTCTTYEATEQFWLAFFRRAPAPELPRAGRGLWNLAG